MATPKGMRAVPLRVNKEDAVHVYSDHTQIWLQLRRKVATEHQIGKPSFKAALRLTPGTARKLAAELLRIARRNEAKLKAKASSSTKQPPTKVKQPAASPAPK